MPPPLPTRPLPVTVAADPGLLDESAEAGLRILAALEAMESLEPDFGDDLAGEASVTIIERAAPFDVPPPLDAGNASARSPQSNTRKMPDVDAARHAAYHGRIEEAVVEIFEGPSPAPAAPGRRRKKARPVGQRFFKALTDGGKG